MTRLSPHEHHQDVRLEGVDRFGNHPPRLVTEPDGAYTVLVPNSRQTEMIVWANGLAGYRALDKIEENEAKIDKILSGKRKVLLENPAWGKTLDADVAGLRAANVLLNKKIATITNLNARLRGKTPYEAPVSTPEIPPKQGLLARLGSLIVKKPFWMDVPQPLFNPHMLEARFNQDETATIMQNLVDGANELTERKELLQKKSEGAEASGSFYIASDTPVEKIEKREFPAENMQSDALKAQYEAADMLNLRTKLHNLGG